MFMATLKRLMVSSSASAWEAGLVQMKCDKALEKHISR